MRHPTVDIVVPARNAAAYLAETLDALGQQRLEAWRAIVVDDGSTDETPRCVRERNDERLLLLGTAGVGAPAARNHGLEHATAAYVMFLDADDVLRPDALERLVAALEQDPSAVLAYGTETLVTGDGKRVEKTHTPAKARYPSGDVLARILAECFIPTTGAALLRTAVVKRQGGFGVGLPASQDWELWCRMALEGRFRFVGGDAVIDYRIHNAAMTRNIDPSRYREANDRVFENPRIRQRLGPEALARLRRRREARNFYNSAKESIRQGDWQRSRRWLLQSLRRDPRNARAVLLLPCAIAGRAPAWILRRIGTL